MTRRESESRLVSVLRARRRLRGAVHLGRRAQVQETAKPSIGRRGLSRAGTGSTAWGSDLGGLDFAARVFLAVEGEHLAALEDDALQVDGALPNPVQVAQRVLGLVELEVGALVLVHEVQLAAVAVVAVG